MTSFLDHFFIVPVVAKEMREVKWDPAKANIPGPSLPKFNDPNVPTTEGLIPADPVEKREPFRQMSIEEEMDMTSGLTDLMGKMDESRSKREEATKRIRVLQAQLKKQEVSVRALRWSRARFFRLAGDAVLQQWWWSGGI
jgi:hypothetical protein